jgi:hypothetical protein
MRSSRVIEKIDSQYLVLRRRNGLEMIADNFSIWGEKKSTRN